MEIIIILIMITMILYVTVLNKIVKTGIANEVLFMYGSICFILFLIIYDSIQRDWYLLIR